jgi:hypothetical protein
VVWSLLVCRKVVSHADQTKVALMLSKDGDWTATTAAQEAKQGLGGRDVGRCFLSASELGDRV